MTNDHLADAMLGMGVRVCKELAGAKRPVIQGNTLLVSSAMWDLMRGSTSEELKRVLAAMGEPLVLPTPEEMFCNISMATSPPPGRMLDW